MSEIEKLYKNAGVEKRELGYCDWDSDCPYDMDKDCGKTCPYWVEEEPDYPPCTPVKQLELIKWLAVFYVHINNEGEEINISTGGGYTSYCAGNLADAIALCINSKWNNLTESEREQIRSILNG